MSRIVFLSHAGIDAYVAGQLKQRIERAVPAGHDVRVWFDKDDLQAGHPWQAQLEQAIKDSSAFVVFVGATGVVNWVEAEVRLALSRAAKDPSYRIVPVLASGGPSASSLPGFLQQYECVRDVDADPEQFRKLIRALLEDQVDTVERPLETEPFFGLSAITEDRSQLFFGRDREKQALADVVALNALTLVVGDSGSGKSSLVHAGLVPRFLGGAIDPSRDVEAEQAIWHVLSMRPRSRPLEALGDVVADAAKRLGHSQAEAEDLAKSAVSAEPGVARRALRCQLPPESTRVLLVIDQFEELFTQGTASRRDAFIEHLLRLIDPEDLRLRVVATMRNDYFNLCSPYKALSEQINAHGRRGRFLLGRMRDEDLRQIVTAPLQLAGIGAQERETLASEVLSDMGQRAGDLALVQMALTETWQARSRHAGSLVAAYTAIGRVEGAVAVAAEMVREQLLDDAQRELLENILVRLVRLGDTGGAVRCIAYRREFTPEAWSLITLLSDKKHKRLLLVGGDEHSATVEIAHEALVTAWPWLQNYLQSVADDKRTLDWLMSKCALWESHQTDSEADGYLATGAELKLFEALRAVRPGWCSASEHDFIAQSSHAEQVIRDAREAEQQRRQEAQRRLRVAATVVAAMFAVISGIASYFWLQAGKERDNSNRLASEANRAASQASEAASLERQARLRAQAEQLFVSRPDSALLIAGRLGLENPSTATWQTLMALLHETPSLVRMHWGKNIQALNSDGSKAISCAGNFGVHQVQVVDTTTGHTLQWHAREKDQHCIAAAFSPDDSSLAVVEVLFPYSGDIAPARLWAPGGGMVPLAPTSRYSQVSVTSFSGGLWAYRERGYCFLYELNSGKPGRPCAPSRALAVETAEGGLRVLHQDNGKEAVISGPMPHPEQGEIRLAKLPESVSWFGSKKTLLNDEFLILGNTFLSTSGVSSICFRSLEKGTTVCSPMAGSLLGLFDRSRVLVAGVDGLEIWDPKLARPIGMERTISSGFSSEEPGRAFFQDSSFQQQEYALRNTGRIRLGTFVPEPEAIRIARTSPRVLVDGPVPGLQTLHDFAQDSPAGKRHPGLGEAPTLFALSEHAEKLLYLRTGQIFERQIVSGEERLLGTLPGEAMALGFSVSDLPFVVSTGNNEVVLSTFDNETLVQLGAFSCHAKSSTEDRRHSRDRLTDQWSFRCGDSAAYLLVTVAEVQGRLSVRGQYLSADGTQPGLCPQCVQGRNGSLKATIMSGAALDSFVLEGGDPSLRLHCRVAGDREQCIPNSLLSLDCCPPVSLSNGRALVLDPMGPSAAVVALTEKAHIVAQLQGRSSTGTLTTPKVSRDGDMLVLETINGVALYRGLASGVGASDMGAAWLPVRKSVQVALSGDGKTLAYVGKSVTTLYLETGFLAQKACELVGRTMHSTESRAYGAPFPTSLTGKCG
jgi:TIR domain